MLDLTKQTIDSCSSSITTKYNKLKSSVTSLTDSLTPCCHYTKPKKSKNNIGSSNDQVKTQQSLHFDDFKLAQNSVYSVQRPRFNVFKTKCSSSYMNKSAITADTTAMDTFCTENQSISYLDIPSERMQNKIFTTYEDYQEHTKDTKEIIEPTKTEDSERKTFSFKSGRRSNSAQVRSRAASRYRDCSPESKAKELNTSTSCILNKRGSKDTVRSNFQRKMDFENELEKSPLRTPKLGTLGSLTSLNFGTKESTQTVLKERKCFNNQEEYAKDPIKELKMAQEEMLQEKEALKMRIVQLKRKIKEEEGRKFELQATTQSWEDASQRMTKRSKLHEKKGLTTKTQIHNLRKEIITILQQNDEDQMGMDYIKELIGNEQQVIAEYKEEIRDMKTMLMEENREKERTREQIEKDKRALVKIIERDKYTAFLEEKHARSKLMK